MTRVAHLLRCSAEHVDWGRLIDLFGEHWRVLATHLVLFGYVYPSERHRIPSRVMDELLSRLGAEARLGPSPERVCRGTLLSRAQYLVDVESWAYDDARKRPRGTLTPREIASWTRAIDEV